MFTITQIDLDEERTIDAISVWPLFYETKGAAIVVINEEATAMLGEAAELEQDGENDFILNDQIVFRITEHQRGY